MNRVCLCVLALGAACVLTLGGCQRRVAGAPPLESRTLGLTHVDVLMSVMGGPQRFYTIQGVLEQDGVPVTGVQSISAVLLDDGVPIPDGSGGATAELDAQGRFTARIPIAADPKTLASDSAVSVQISVFDGGGFVNVGPPIPIDFAPRAYGAVYAETAGEVEGGTTLELEPFFNAGWANLGFDLERVRATRVGNMVFLQGTIENVAATDGILLTLPEGWRPVRRHYAVCWGLRTAIGSFDGNGKPYRVDVLSNGLVFFSNPTPAVFNDDFICLNGLYFSLD